MTAIDIWQATVRDARRIAHVMGAAFQHDPVSNWLLPQLDDRLRTWTHREEVGAPHSSARLQPTLAAQHVELDSSSRTARQRVLTQILGVDEYVLAATVRLDEPVPA